MKISAADFFSPEDKEQIKAAIEKAEASSSGEIAVMVVDQSDSYREGASLGGAILSGIVSLLLGIIIATAIYSRQIWSDGSIWSLAHVVSEVKDHLTVWYYIPLVCLLYFPCRYLLMGLPGFRVRFLSRRRLEETVKERALRVFYERGLYRTRDATGILIFISLLERIVWIMGDRGINEKIPAQFWNERAQDLTRGIKVMEHGRAVQDTIRRCGDELAKFFPRRPDDVNELPDEVIS
jgi:putative membrane protein